MQNRAFAVAPAFVVATTSFVPVSVYASTPSRPSYDDFQRDATVLVNSGSSVKNSYERAVGSSFDDAVAAGSFTEVVRHASRADIVLTALLGAFAAGSTGYYMVLQGMVPNPLPGIIPSPAKK